MASEGECKDMARITEVTGEDMFADYLLPDVLYVITTNGDVKLNGECVMGRGVARMAKSLVPSVSKQLGDLILTHGNRPFLLSGNFVSLPVKHHWGDSADPVLIRKSIQRMASLLRVYDWSGLVFLPRPGCGNGGLKWEDIRGMVTDLVAATWDVKEVAIFGQ